MSDDFYSLGYTPIPQIEVPSGAFEIEYVFNFASGHEAQNPVLKTPNTEVPVDKILNSEQNATISSSGIGHKTSDQQNDLEELKGQENELIPESLKKKEVATTEFDEKQLLQNLQGYLLF